MYHYLNDEKFERKMRRLGGEIMQELSHILKEKYGIGARIYLVGSGARNMILQNNNNPVDLDYNLEIVKCDDFYDSRYIKECVQKSLNIVLKRRKLDDCQDSTSCLSTGFIYFTSGNPTEFKFDICITARRNDNTYMRLIHHKTGIVALDSYSWETAPSSKDIREKERYIKENGKWESVRQEYLRNKNMYLCMNDHNHPSYVCYAEAVNNVNNSIRNQNMFHNLLITRENTWKF